MNRLYDLLNEHLSNHPVSIYLHIQSHPNDPSHEIFEALEKTLDHFDVPIHQRQVAGDAILRLLLLDKAVELDHQDDRLQALLQMYKHFMASIN
jgi:hypothetical protein